MMTFVSFGGRSYRLHMWVGDDFRNPGRCWISSWTHSPGLGTAAQGLALGTTLMWMAFDRGKESMWKNERSA